MQNVLLSNSLYQPLKKVPNILDLAILVVSCEWSWIGRVMAGKILIYSGTFRWMGIVSYTFTTTSYPLCSPLWSNYEETFFLMKDLWLKNTNYKVESHNITWINSICNN